MATSVAKLRELIGDLTQIVDHYDEEDPVQRLALRIKANEVYSLGQKGLDVGICHLINMMELMAIRTLISVKAFYHIPLEGSISLADLSEKTGLEDSMLERLLRIVICTGLINHKENLEYEHTHRSKEYRVLHSPQAIFLCSYDECFIPLSRLHIFLAERNYREPDNQSYSPHPWSENAEGKAIWEVMAKYPERLEAFQVGLSLMDDLTITGGYDFSQLKSEDDRPIMVAIGGSLGQEVAAILKQWPELPANKFYIQDLEEPITLAHQNESLPKDVHKMVNDFWKDQPVKGAKAYYMRRIIHDYSDKFCCKIFDHIKAAMAPDSVILIVDMIPADRTTPWDIGSIANDMGVLTMGGKNRNIAGYKKLFDRAGLELVNIWEKPGELGSLVEARIAR